MGIEEQVNKISSNSASDMEINTNQNEYSFTSNDTDSEVDEIISDNLEDNDENSSNENMSSVRRRYNWIKKPQKSLEDALQLLKVEGFVQYDHKTQTSGEKFYFRCEKVTKRSKKWCELKYNIFLPGNEDIVYLEHNNAKHTHDQIKSQKRELLSIGMVQFLHSLYANKTVNYESVIMHINHARSTKNMFQDEVNPKYRQHEYQLKKFRSAEVKPVVSVGDIAEFCTDNSTLPQGENEHFVLKWETSTTNEEMYFRFCMCTPYLLKQFETLTTICIDATYKLNWMGFPLIVMGTVDRGKRFHPLLYGCSSKETSEDYAFFFGAVKEGVKTHGEKEFNAQILIADGDNAIRNGFYSAFPNAKLVVMCYAHVIRNCRKRPFVSKNNKTLILDDIGLLQLAANREEFDAMSTLFLKKWKELEPDFISYFKNEWLTSRCNWFEGAADYTPSTNNALESHNSNIKRNWTFRKRLQMNQFFVAMIEMTVAASQKLSSGDQQVALEPKIPKQMMMKGVELEVNSLKTFKARSKDKSSQDEIVLLVASEKCTNPTHQFYKQIQKQTWNSFGEYVEYGFHQFYLIHLSKSNWKVNSRCTCPSFLKQFMCKHIIATAIREKLMEVTPTMNPTLLANGRIKRGRPKNASKALLVQ